MSAICGIFNLDGKPVSSQVMESMMAALCHRGPDGSEVFLEGPVGLGHQMFHITPESLEEKLPYHKTDSGLIITADIRLDNRDELFPALGLTPSDLGIPDSQLALNAYEKWGSNMPNHLEGDYGIVIWDIKKRQLVIFTDPAGMRPVFYYQKGNRFIFATEIKGILAVPSLPKRLNKRFLAMNLTVPETPFALPETTFFEDISAMTAASVMVISSKGIDIRRHWIPDISRRIAFKTENEWTEAFQELFFNVVNARMRSAFPVVSLLSGGLDSSAVTAFASEILKRQGQRLRTFSAVLPDGYSGSGTDERYFIDLFNEYDNIDMKYITDEWRGPFDDLDLLIQGGESPFYTSRHFLYTAFSHAAREQGARVILDGCFGEMGPSFHGDGCLAELLLKGRLFELTREVVLRSRRENRRAVGIIKGEIIKPILPVRLQARITPRFDTTEMSRNMPVQKEFINRWVGESEIAGIQKGLQSLLYTHPIHRRNQGGVFQRKKSCFTHSGFNGYEHIVSCYPFADRRIIEFCLASPEWIKVRNGYKRYMIRAGMKGLAPSEIRWRTTKEPFSPDYHDRYNRQKKIAVDLLYGIGNNDPIREIVDLERIKKGLSEKMTGNRCDTHQGFMSMHVVPRTVYLCRFLRLFDEYKV
jgi:asparagine synthase (glutamine-hydrolysing)